ncbi:MAG: transposase [Deltaproteobacteria bacterium]|nr:transposase [Deltaproteobacteria bacterium]
MPRQARLDAPGTLHHVIVRGIERRRIVDDDYDRGQFVSRLGKLAVETGTSIYAWALMTNHAHLLVNSGAQGLAKFMRRFLTGYSVTYNWRHRRHGHLFQNRYKSIVCDGDQYFTELVRYIHLNPLRVKLVSDLEELEKHPYCGHSAILGTTRYDWQDRDSVLSQFGRREGDAKALYGKFVDKGARLGRRPELVGGGLVRSMGGWSEVKSRRRRGTRESYDERILGSGVFVERVIQEAERQIQREYAASKRGMKIERVIKAECRKHKISLTELRGGSRRGQIPEARAELSRKLVTDYGISLAEVARQVGVSTSAVSKILARSNSS